MDPVEEFLEHWGVKGMHWGIRNARSRKALAKKERRNSNEEFKTVHNLRKKKVSELSSAELELVNKRLNLEKNFASLNPKQVSKGRKATKFILTTSGTIVVGAATKAASKKVSQYFERKIKVAAVKAATP